MSEFVFFYPNDYFDAATLCRAFYARRGRIPASTDVRVERCSSARNFLRFTTSTNVSGTFYIPCVERRSGLFFASTETLPPFFTEDCSSAQPRSLLLELARGQLSRILRKRADWLAAGLRIPNPIWASIRREASRFSALATSDRNAENFDAESIATFESLRAESLRLNELFLERALETRQAGTGAWETTLGFSTVPSPEFFASFWGRRGALRSDRPRRRGLATIFQTFNPKLAWADVETEEGQYDWTAFDAALDWAKERGLKTTIGPLFRWERRSSPRWLWGRSDENAATVEAFRRFVDAILARDERRTTRWIVATNVEKDGFGAPSEVRYVLAEETAQKIARSSPDAEAYLGFEQPLGDAARFRRRSSISPAEFAAQIARRRTFDGFYLELNFGLSRRATAPRDPMEWHRFFDQWASFGTRLSVATSYPSSEPDENGRNGGDGATFADSTWNRWFGRRKSGLKRDSASRVELLTAAPEDRFDVAESYWTEKTQQENVRRFLLTALARRSVGEVVWTRLFDAPSGWDEEDEESSESTAFDLDDSPPEDAPPFVLREDEENESDADRADQNADQTTRRTVRRAQKKKPFAEPGTAFEPFSTSGLIGIDGKPKPSFHKLAALKQAYFD